MAKIKLSETQKDIVKLLQSGEWEIGYSSGVRLSRGWMQKGGLGRGGEAKDINVATFRALKDKGLIEQGEYGFPTRHYIITDLCKQLQLETT